MVVLYEDPHIEHLDPLPAWLPLGCSSQGHYYVYARTMNARTMSLLCRTLNLARILSALPHRALRVTFKPMALSTQ